MTTGKKSKRPTSDKGIDKDSDTVTGSASPLPERLLLAGALFGLLLALVTASPSDQRRLSNDGAIAKVNQQHIDRTEFAGAYQALLSDKNKAPTAADKKLVLDRLIEEELLVQRGLEIGLLEGDAAVRKAVAMAVIEFVLAQKGSDALSETNLRRFYNQHKARFAPANRLQVSRIFVPYMEPRQSPEMTKKLDVIRDALRGVGADLHHIGRVRVYLTDMSYSAGFIKAHGEVFAGIEPVLTAVTAGLTQDGLVVEIDVDAVIHSDGVVDL